MAFSGNTSSARGVPRLPTPFHGELIASYATYEQAQRAVDYLSDEGIAGIVYLADRLGKPILV